MLVRYQLSSLLKIPHDCPEFESAISVFPADDDWDVADVVQMGYLRAGLKRYKVDYQNTMNTKTKTTSEKETAESSTYGSKSLSASASSGDVKIELATYAMLGAEMKMISQGESKLSAENKKLKGLLVELEISKKPDANLRIMQARQAIEAVEKAQHSLLTFVAVFKALPSDDEAQVEGMASEVKGRADEASDVLDAVKQIGKRLQMFLLS